MVFFRSKSIFKNDLYNDVSIQFTQGIPSLEYIDEFKPNIIVIDDLMDDSKSRN